MRRLCLVQYRAINDTIAKRIPLLSARPMLLAHIPDVIARGTRITYAFQLYEAMVDAWIERESTWAGKDALREFSERLAVDILLNREVRGMERVPYGELLKLAEQWDLNLGRHQITGRSLLNRDAEGNYKFAHRSIMEYLFVKKLIGGDKRCQGTVLTDQMKQFIIEMLSVSTPEAMSVFSSRFLMGSEWTARNATTAEKTTGEFLAFTPFRLLTHLLSIREVPLLFSQSQPWYEFCESVDDSLELTSEERTAVKNFARWLLYTRDFRPLLTLLATLDPITLAALQWANRSPLLYFVPSFPGATRFVLEFVPSGKPTKVSFLKLKLATILESD